MADETSVPYTPLPWYKEILAVRQTLIIVLTPIVLLFVPFAFQGEHGEHWRVSMTSLVVLMNVESCYRRIFRVNHVVVDGFTAGQTTDQIIK